MRPHLRSLLGLSVPLSWLLVHLLTVAWERRLSIPSLDARDAVVTQYGFPLPFRMDSPFVSVSWFYFLGPLLLDWLVYLGVLSRLLWAARRVWPERWWPWRRPLSWLAWGLAVPTLLTFCVDLGVGQHALTSPYPVLEDGGARLYLGLGRHSESGGIR